MAPPVASEKGARHRLRHTISESETLLNYLPRPLYSHNACTSDILQLHRLVDVGSMIASGSLESLMVRMLYSELEAVWVPFLL